MRLLSVLLIFFLVNAMQLNAHELWLQAKEYEIKKDKKLIAHIKVGQNLIGENYPYLKEETEKLFIQNKKGLVNLKQIDGDFPAIQQNLIENDTQYLYYQSNKEILQYENYEIFLEFINDYKLPYNSEKKSIPKEIYQRFAKIIFKYNGKNFFHSKQNLEFEIINLNDPYTNNISEIKILIQGKPFSNRQFLVFYLDGDKFKKKKYKTNNNGFAKIDTSQPGLYLVSAVHLVTLNYINQIKYKADYYSKWASLTFKKTN